jgi:hypothetical protein
VLANVDAQVTSRRSSSTMKITWWGPLSPCFIYVRLFNILPMHFSNKHILLKDC